MSNKTSLISMQLKVAGDTDTRTLRNVVKSIATPGGVMNEREYAVKDTPVVHIGLASALVTVIIPTRRVNVNLTIDATSVSYQGVTWPIVLPGSISSVEMFTDSADIESTVYIYQAL